MRRLTSTRLAFTSLMITIASASATASEWGTIKGRFVLDGPPPEPTKLTINKDVEFCGKYEPRSEKLLVNREGRGISNVVIWLDTKTGEKVAVHPSFAETATAKIKLANKGCRFDPHVCVLRTGQSLVIENPDQVDHNTAAGLDRNQPFNDLVPMGKSSERPKFSQPEKLPSQVQCSIHPWMIGWLVVKDHPYVAVTDEHGRFELKNLPVGEHTFVVWHELPGFVENVTRNGKPETWKRGKVTVRISTGETEFGDVQVTGESLK